MYVCHLHILCCRTAELADTYVEFNALSALIQVSERLPALADPLYQQWEESGVGCVEVHELVEDVAVCTQWDYDLRQYLFDLAIRFKHRVEHLSGTWAMERAGNVFRVPVSGQGAYSERCNNITSIFKCKTLGQTHGQAPTVESCHSMPQHTECGLGFFGKKIRTKISIPSLIHCLSGMASTLMVK